MVSQQTPLAAAGHGQDLRVELEPVQIRRKALRDPALRVADLQQMAHAVAAVGAAAMPHLAAKDHHVARVAEDALLLPSLPGRVAVGRAAGAVAAGDEAGRADLLGEVVQVVVGGGDVDRNAHARVGHHVLRQRERLVVGVQRLVGPPRPGQPGGHGDDVAVCPEQRLGDLDDAGVVQELHEVRVAIEGVVDRPVEEAALRVGTAIEALGQRLQALHLLAQFRHLIAIEHPGQIHVPVPLDGVDLTRHVRLGYQRQGFRHRGLLLPIDRIAVDEPIEDVSWVSLVHSIGHRSRGEACPSWRCR